MNYSDLTLLGQSGAPAQRRLETFPTPPGCTEVRFHTDEFTSLCPITGQPDYSSITIIFAPNQACLESKSLKLYLQTFRNEGSFCEALAAQIAQDIKDAVSPHWVSVTVDQNPRGGIGLIAKAFLGPDDFGIDEDSQENLGD